MTFKHTKFEDSPTMRALEKVAKEKGLVKAEALQKKAAVTKKADYTPTDDFMENIFKLCAGLRTAGFEKEASEIEVNYLNYKKAQTLYETSKEKGEDLVQAAHPKGSHKLEGVEGEEATVEDILDQHLKMMKTIEKKPTGKLSTAASIIGAVKTVLGQSGPLDIIAQQQIKGRDLWTQIDTEVRKNTSKWALHWSEDYSWVSISDRIKSLLTRKPEEMTVDAIESFATNVREAFEFVSDMKKEDLMARLKGAFGQMFTLYGPMRRARDEFNKGESAKRVEPYIPKPPKPQNNFGNQVNALEQRFNLYSAQHYENKVPPASKQKIINFLAGIKSTLDILATYKGKKDSELDPIKADLDKMVLDVTNKLNQFKASVIDKAPAGAGPTG